MKKNEHQVSCYEIQHKIKAYILGEMELDEAKEFVEHVRGCKECRDELEEYYAFSSALMQLDNVEDEKGNFFMNIEKRLERTEAAVMKAHKDHVWKKTTYILIALLVAAALGVSFGV